MSFRDPEVEGRNVHGTPVRDMGWNAKLHYSKSLPKGEAPDYSPDTYNYELLDCMLLVKVMILTNQAWDASNKAGWTNREVKGYDAYMGYVSLMQKELIKIGYLDPGEDDGIMGPKTEGAMKRYAYNKPNWAEETWHSIKNLDLNLFD